MREAAERQEYRKAGNLFVVSAPSGAGKTTLCRLLCDRLEDIRHSVSYTTRPPREGEVNDVDYTFVDRDTFMGMVEKGEFIEWAEVHGNYYGTSGRRVEALKAEGIDVIMDIDTQGARQLMERGVKAAFVFIMPPSLGVLRARLEGRNTDAEDVIRRRLTRAREEISDYHRYEYVIINDSLERALDELRSIVLAVRCRRENIDDGWIDDNFLKEVE